MRSSQQMVLRTQIPLPVRFGEQPPSGGPEADSDDAGGGDAATLVLIEEEVRVVANREVGEVEATSVIDPLELVAA